MHLHLPALLVLLLAAPAALAASSFASTCRNARVDSRLYLVAGCKATSGAWRDAELNLHNCLVNRRGMLKYEKKCVSRPRPG